MLGSPGSPLNGFRWGDELTGSLQRFSFQKNPSSKLISIAALNKAMAGMPERFRAVLTAVGQGRSYSEIGDQLGMTKQGVHKIAAAAMHSLKEHLESQGYGGLDSVGLLKSFRQE